MAVFLTIRIFTSWTVWIVLIVNVDAQDHVIEMDMGAQEDSESQYVQGMGSPTLPTNSAPTSLPSTPDGSPVKVFCGFFIESLGDIRQSEMTYDLDIYFHQTWRDSRLNHTHSSAKALNDQNSLIGMWLPDLYFANAKRSSFQTVTVPNFALYIEPDGTVAYSSRITLHLACNLQLHNYPLDSQTCAVKILSYTHTDREMNVDWFKENPISYYPDIELPEFRIQSVKDEKCNGTFTYSRTERSGKTGNFSCLLANIHLKRSIGYHLVQTYIPTGMIVIISWVSFWIDPMAVPARVSLSFTTLLTLATQGTGIRYSLPPVSYAKAIDYWYGTCMLFLFAALLEFAVVNSYMRQSQKFDVLLNPDSSKAQEDGAMGFHGRASVSKHPQVKAAKTIVEKVFAYRALCLEYAKKATRIDQISRVLFPVVFIIFNLIYWVWYKILFDWLVNQKFLTK